MGFKPDNKYSFSIDHLWNRKRADSLDEKQEIKAHKKAHLLHFERWNRSLRTKYLVEALFILLG